MCAANWVETPCLTAQAPRTSHLRSPEDVVLEIVFIILPRNTCDDQSQHEITGITVGVPRSWLRLQGLGNKNRQDGFRRLVLPEIQPCEPIEEIAQPRSVCQKLTDRNPI